MDRRIVAQDGWFTVHKLLEDQQRFIPLEDQNRYRNRLSYVAVPPAAFARLRLELNRCGVNTAALLADLPGLSRHIQWKMSPMEDEER